MSRNPGTDLRLRAVSTDRGKAGRGHWAGCLAIVGGNLVRVRERYRASSASVGERDRLYSATVLTSSPDPKQCFGRHHLAQYMTRPACPPSADRPTATDTSLSALQRVPHLPARYSSLTRAAFPHRGYLCFTRI